MIGHAEIAALIPHAGRMCLLQGVLRWDAGSILCSATSHRDPSHPLALDGRLSAACGLEYAAQAMALHGRLANPAAARPRSGYLASVRALVLEAEYLDEVPEDLAVAAERLAGDGDLVAYAFAVEAGGRRLLYGRATVLLDLPLERGGA